MALRFLDTKAHFVSKCADPQMLLCIDFLSHPPAQKREKGGAPS